MFDTLSSTFVYGVRARCVALFIITKFVMFTVQRVAERCRALQCSAERCSAVQCAEMYF